MRRPIRLSTLPTCLAIAAATAGCGDQPLTKAEYVKQADEICKEAKAEQQRFGTPTSVEAIVELATKSGPIWRDEVERLRALEAPDELKPTAKAAYDLLDQRGPALDAFAAAAKAGEAERLAALSARRSSLEGEIRAAARPIGFKVCP